MVSSLFLNHLNNTIQSVQGTVVIVGQANFKEVTNFLSLYVL